MIQLYFLVQPLTWWFVQFVDDADYDFLGSGSEVSNVRNKVFWQLVGVFLLALQIRAPNVAPVVLKLEVPALVLSGGKHVAKLTLF